MKKYLFIVLFVGVWSCESKKPPPTTFYDTTKCWKKGCSRDADGWRYLTVSDSKRLYKTTNWGGRFQHNIYNDNLGYCSEQHGWDMKKYLKETGDGLAGYLSSHKISEYPERCKRLKPELYKRWIDHQKMDQQNQIKILSDEDLLKNYTEYKFIEKSLTTTPPFFISINGDSDIGILVEQDTLKPYTKFLSPGKEVRLEGFVSSAKLIFTNTDKIKARLNGEVLSLIENYPHPLKVFIRSSPPSISVSLFTPLD